MCLWQWRKRGGVEEETALFPQRRKRGAQEKRCAFQPVARTAATDGACKARPAAGQKLIINRGKKNTTRSRSAKARRATISPRCFLMLLGQLSLIPAEPPPPDRLPPASLNLPRCALPGRPLVLFSTTFSMDERTMADSPEEKLKETPPNQPFFILRWVDVSWFYFHALSKLVFASFTTSKLGNCY